MTLWIKVLVRFSDIPKKSVSSIPDEGSGELSEGKLTGDNWHPLNMTRGTRTVNPGKQNQRLSSRFQPPEEGRSVQQTKRSDEQGDKDEDNSPKNVNNVHITSSQKYRQIKRSLRITNKKTFLIKHWNTKYLASRIISLAQTDKGFVS